MDKKNKKLSIKVLVISYDFYPDNSPNTYRWHNILKQWVDLGCEIYVVSAQKVGFSKSETIDGIRIYRTGKSWFEILKTKLNKGVDGDNLATKHPTNIAKESILKKIYDNTFKQLYFPDFAFLWRAPAQKLANEILKEHGINNVITVSWPFTDHVVGYNLRKQNKFNWIADTIDPFYLSKAVNNSSLYNKLNYFYEKKILKKADVVTVLTEKLKGQYVKMFPALKGKVVVNHNLFIPYSVESSTEKVKNTFIKLVFMGTLSPITRSPKNILEIFRQTLKIEDNLQLHFYGNLQQCEHEFKKYAELIDKNVFLHSFVTRDNAQKILLEADVVVNIGNNNAYQEPSKVVEYIYLKKKILNVCSIEDDTSKELLVDYPFHMNLNPSDCYDDEKLSEIVEFLKNKSINMDHDVMSSINKFLISSVERKYFMLLNFYND